MPDIDFYSPEPIIDLMKLCNILHKAGYKAILGREALHQETYNITVNCLTYCDITYVPKNIYNRMPFTQLNQFNVIRSDFMWIDYLRMFTDPMRSYWRMNNDLKSLRRFFLLQKYYNFPVNNNSIDIEGSTPDIDKVLNVVYNFLLYKKSTISIGFYAYNYFLNESGVIDSSKNKKFKMLPIPYFEFISTNFREDCLNLIDMIRNIPLINTSKITREEFYPFFQYLDHSVEIYYDGDLIARIYNHNRLCIPYIDVRAVNFLNNETTRDDSFVRIGTFPVNLMYMISSIMRARVKKDDSEQYLYHAISSHLIEMRNYFFKKTRTNILSDTIFREFSSKCVGKTMTLERERKLLIESRKKNNKKWIFSYEPSDELKEPESSYVFSNTSGNKIINSKNLKLAAIKVENSIEGDFDDDVN